MYLQNQFREFLTSLKVILRGTHLVDVSHLPVVHCIKSKAHVRICKTRKLTKCKTQNSTKFSSMTALLYDIENYNIFVV